MWFNPAKIEKFQRAPAANSANSANPESEISKLARLATGKNLKTNDRHSEISKLAKLAGDHSAQVGAGDTALEADPAIAYRAWLIHYPDRDPVQSYCTPPATHAEILASHPDAIAAEPFEPVQMRDIPVISAKDEQAIRSWLEHIGETDGATIGKVMTLCQQDQSARDYFTRRAAEELPKPDTYADDRRTCSQCRSLDGRVCTIASPGGVVSAVKGYTPNRTTLMRCAGFVARGTA
jgi:hypothetical protein